MGPCCAGERTRSGDTTVRKIAFLMVSAAVVLLLASCSGYSRYDGSFEDEMPTYEQYEDEMNAPIEDYEPSPAEIDAAMRESEQRVREELSIGSWSCVYDETWNDDWHDDVVCSNGSEAHRPYLREWDSFVEYWEIMESAAEYEAQLNAGG